MFVNSQLVCLPLIGIFKPITFTRNISFWQFQWHAYELARCSWAHCLLSTTTFQHFFSSRAKLLTIEITVQLIIEVIYLPITCMLRQVYTDRTVTQPLTHGNDVPMFVCWYSEHDLIELNKWQLYNAIFVCSLLMNGLRSLPRDELYLATFFKYIVQSSLCSFFVTLPGWEMKTALIEESAVWVWKMLCTAFSPKLFVFRR